MADYRDRMDGANRRRIVERLADLPGQTLGERLALPITPRQIDPSGIAVNEVERAIHGNIYARLTDRNDQLHLELEIIGLWRIRNFRSFRDNGIGCLLEETRRIALVGFPHASNVPEIIAADTIDTLNGKRIFPTDNRQRDDFWSE